MIPVLIASQAKHLKPFGLSLHSARSSLVTYANLMVNYLDDINVISYHITIQNSYKI